MKSHYLINDLELVQTGASPTKKKTRGWEKKRTNKHLAIEYALDDSSIFICVVANYGERLQ